MKTLFTGPEEGRIKKIRLYFGSRNIFARITGVGGKDIVIYSTTHPGENVNLGHHMEGGIHKAVEMWFTLSREENTQIGITPVCWG